MTCSLRIQARKLKTLLETTFGWDLENNAANLIDEDDEVSRVMNKPATIFVCYLKKEKKRKKRTIGRYLSATFD